MKILLLIALIMTIQNAFSMGDGSILERSTGNESLNDMSETSIRMPQFSSARGYKDQQMMDEDPELMQERIDEMKLKDEALEEKTIEKKKEKEVQPPYEGPRIIHE